MSDTGIHEGDYPRLTSEPLVGWGPGFEGSPDMPNEFSADAALLAEAGDGEGMTVAGLTIVLARREEGPEPQTPQTPIAVGIELTLEDVRALADWAAGIIGATEAAMEADPKVERGNPAMTKAGWKRLVSEVAALEDAAADGNTWGPDTDAAILANIVTSNLRKV